MVNLIHVQYIGTGIGVAIKKRLKKQVRVFSSETRFLKKDVSQNLFNCMETFIKASLLSFAYNVKCKFKCIN